MGGPIFRPNPEKSGYYWAMSKARPQTQPDKRALQAEIRRLCEALQEAKNLVDRTTKQLRAAENQHRGEFGRAYHARIHSFTGELMGFTDEGADGFDLQEWWTGNHKRALACVQHALGIGPAELQARLQIRQASDVERLPKPPAPKPPARPRGRPRRELERDEVISALRANGGSIRKTAEATGWARNTLARFMTRENIGPGIWVYAELELKPEHGQLLERSAISPDVAKARGYSSVRDGLRIPVWDVEGRNPWGQVRLNNPRRNSRRYRNDSHAIPVIDVPPACRELVRDAKRLLYVCESPRGADAGASAGLACVAMLGARFTVTDLSAWEPFHLRGRRVCIVFDADAETNPDVRQHEKLLASFLASQGALVTVARLPTIAGPKTGLDDFLAAGGDVTSLFKQPKA